MLQAYVNEAWKARPSSTCSRYSFPLLTHPIASVKLEKGGSGAKVFKRIGLLDLELIPTMQNEELPDLFLCTFRQSSQPGELIGWRGGRGGPSC